MKKGTLLLLAASLLVFTQCKEEHQESKGDNRTTTAEAPASTPPRQSFTYHAIRTRDSSFAELKKMDSAKRAPILALNRIDWENVRRADTLIVPDPLVDDLMQYAPFPASVPFLKDVKKIIFFSYPIQAFGAYEKGQLVRWGPTSMGRKVDTTPTGLHFTNWKAVETTSTVKDEWILKWNFNIMNKDGVGWHLYSLPGYPASHSCLRLLINDAQYLYDWADQWIQADKETVAANGTPVVVFGQYPFGQKKPWLHLLEDPKANDISADNLQKEVENYLPQILAEQHKTDSVRTAKGK